MSWKVLGAHFLFQSLLFSSFYFDFYVRVISQYFLFDSVIHLLFDYNFYLFIISPYYFLLIFIFYDNCGYYLMAKQFSHFASSHSSFVFHNVLFLLFLLMVLFSSLLFSGVFTSWIWVRMQRSKSSIYLYCHFYLIFISQLE